jgi:H+/Cl- antiporter ClcA
MIRGTPAVERRGRRTNSRHAVLPLSASRIRPQLVVWGAMHRAFDRGGGGGGGGALRPSTFALMMAVALLAGTQHSSIALVVIIMEGTGRADLLIPIVLAVITARSVSQHFVEGM